jgi:hypothetical protein
LCGAIFFVMRWLETFFKRRPWTAQIISICMSYLQPFRCRNINQTFFFQQYRALYTGTLQRVSKYNFSKQIDRAGPLVPSLPRYEPIGFCLLGLCKGPDIPSKSWQCAWTSCTSWKTHGVQSSAVWTFCALRMTFTLRCIELDELFFQIKHTNSPYLFILCVCVCVCLKCGE